MAGPGRMWAVQILTTRGGFTACITIRLHSHGILDKTPVGLLESLRKPTERLGAPRDESRARSSQLEGMERTVLLYRKQSQRRYDLNVVETSIEPSSGHGSGAGCLCFLLLFLKMQRNLNIMP